jgi:hypothetical protein
VTKKKGQFFFAKSVSYLIVLSSFRKRAYEREIKNRRFFVQVTVV